MSQSNMLNINLVEGWNLISGLHSMTSYIEDMSNIIINDTLYEFNQIYTKVEKLEPGKGYWVRASKNGTINIKANLTIIVNQINPNSFIIGNVTKCAVTLPNSINDIPEIFTIDGIQLSDVGVWMGNIIYGDLDLSNNDITEGTKDLIIEYSDIIYQGVVEFTGVNTSDLLSITYNGVNREYFLYVPESYNQENKYPLIFNFHGFGGLVKDYIQFADLRENAKNKNFILVYPQGLNLEESNDSHWNAALPGDDNKSDVDDFGFILSLVNRLQSEFNIDSNRIYACGYSNGAFFSYALGLYHSNIFAAIGSVSGTMVQDLLLENYSINVPLPMINIHGINDSTIPYLGSNEYNSIPNIINFFKQINNTTNEIIDDNDAFTHTVYGNGINDASVEHYKMKTYDHIWYPELNNNLCDFLLKHNLNGLIYDFVIVGGGPSGIMSTYRIATQNPDKRILLIEKNKYTLEEYKTPYTTNSNQDSQMDVDYKNAFFWRLSMNDPKFQYSFSSEDNKSVWMGKGLGGGTLHFGIQYIDDEDVVEKFNPEWKDDFEAVAQITNAQRYNYNEINNNTYNQIKQAINNESNVNYYNNKVYSDDLVNKKRIILGDLINNLPNVKIKYGINIIKYNNSNVEDIYGKKYFGKKFILCAGAIQTPGILLRSNISCGNKLYDHIGFTLIYSKMVPKIITSTQPFQGEKIIILNQANLEILNQKNSERYIFKVTNGPGDGNVYDFTNWVNKHPGGASKITKWAIAGINGNDKYELKYPSSHLTTSNSNRWPDNLNEFTYIGNFGASINYDNLPNNLKSQDLEITLFPGEEITTTTYIPSNLGLETNNILAHLQTRDTEMNWQTYYSAIPGQETILVVTNSTAGNLSGAGSIQLDPEDVNSNPIVILNHFGNNTDKYLNFLKDAYTKNNSILESLGYTIINPIGFNENIIANLANSIYHYHGTCAIDEVVDKSQKVIGKDNLYIGDVSVLNNPWAGSTSVPALVTGYRVAKNFI